MAYDPFQAGGPGSYGGTMLGTEGPKRKHISERGQYADGKPLNADPLEVLRRDRDRLVAEIARLNQELNEVEAKLNQLSTSKSGRTVKTATVPAIKAEPVTITTTESVTVERSKKRKVSGQDEPTSDFIEAGQAKESE